MRLLNVMGLGMREASLHRLETDGMYAMMLRRAYARGLHVILNTDPLQVYPAAGALASMLRMYSWWDEVVYPSLYQDEDATMMWANTSHLNFVVPEHSRILIPQGRDLSRLIACMQYLEQTFPRAIIGMPAWMERVVAGGRAKLAEQLRFTGTRIHLFGIDSNVKGEIRSMLNRARSLTTAVPWSYAQSGMNLWHQRPAAFDDTRRAPEPLVKDNIRMLLRWANGSH